MKTLDAKDEKNGGSAPPTAGLGISPPPWASAGLGISPPPWASVNRIGYPEVSYRTHPFFTRTQPYVIEFPEKDDLWVDPALCLTTFSSDSDDDAQVNRKGRQADAKKFRSKYTYGSSVKDGRNNSKEQKTCIWPGGILSWQDESSGIMWVGVHGMDSVCVVARSDDLDTTRLCGSSKHWPIHEILFDFRKSVIVEIEDLADPSSEIRERFHKRIEKPFGVVSVIPGACKSSKGSRHKASSVEHGETKAIEFLQEKVKSDTVFTVSETIQTAIVAFDHLFQKKFKADEIQVSVMDPNYTVGPFEDKDLTVEDLTIRQINEHLAVLKKHGTPSIRKFEPHPEDSSSGSRSLRERKL